MGEQLITIRKLSELAISINETEYKWKDWGNEIDITVDKLFREKYTPTEFEEKIISLGITDIELIELQNLFGNSYQIARYNIEDILENRGDKTRELTKKVLSLALRCGILGRGTNSAWKVPKLMKEKMLIGARHRADKLDPKGNKSVQDIVNESLDRKQIDKHESINKVEPIKQNILPKKKGV